MSSGLSSGHSPAPWPSADLPEGDRTCPPEDTVPGGILKKLRGLPALPRGELFSPEEADERRKRANAREAALQAYAERVDTLRESMPVERVEGGLARITLSSASRPTSEEKAAFTKAVARERAALARCLHRRCSRACGVGSQESFMILSPDGVEVRAVVLRGVLSREHAELWERMRELHKQVCIPNTPHIIPPPPPPTPSHTAPHFPLPTSYFLLPTSHFPLPTSYFLLPTSYFLLPI